MTIVDTVPEHRALQLNVSESLTTQRLIAALVHGGSHTRAEATESVAHFFDCLEAQLLTGKAL
jgi:hypothetical protein